MTDWGAHHMDIGYWAIGLAGPTQIEAQALTKPIPGGYTTISDYEVKFTYPNGVVFKSCTPRSTTARGAASSTRTASATASASKAPTAGSG